MGHALQWLRSLIFIALMYLAMLVLGLVYLIPTIFSRHWAVRACHAYTGWVRWSARVLVGLRSEIRGTPPEGEVLVAAKHQSFFDILMIFDVMPHPKFIMKRELIWAPILGWYALRLGCVPVDRGKRGAAIEQMKKGVAEGRQLPGQLVIYPQGTRVAPGAQRSYKVGAGVLYEQLGQPCVPAATNVGVFWPRHGFYRKPGLAVVEFLPEIAPGKPVPEFMADLERDIEAASDRLMAEAGFGGGNGK
jgi:1-acyl-sn-glycerol-3-phosphate acyltransferase